MLMDNNSYQQPMQPVQPVPQPIVRNPQDADKKKQLIKTISLAVAILLALVFAVLYFMESSKYSDLNKDFETKVSTAVETRADARLTELEKQFDELDKKPYSKFVGPEDYGSLSFDFPRTWSVYVAEDAAKGGKYDAYFNPNKVEAIKDKHAYALRVEILNESFDSVVADYDRKENLTAKADTVGGASANLYTGTIPNTEFSGAISIFKIRDKTVIITTYDQAYFSDFNNILDSIKFNS